MNFKKTIIILIAATVVLNIQIASAGSIYLNKSTSMKGPYVDDTARKVGDILTVIISEVSEIESKVKRKLEKSTSRDSAWDGEVGVENSIIPIRGKFPAFSISEGTSSNKKLNGKSDFKDEREITDRVSVIVEDVQPNGNLVLIGLVQREVAGDIQIIKISGIVRPSDVSYQNTIKSEQVANFFMVIENKGVSDNYTKVGWIGKILDFIWPF
jgi:flagellar L-ring protein precursor FlgH